MTDDALIPAAFSLADLRGIALYDALYVALAQRLGLKLVTSDRRLFQRVRHLPEVLWIAAWR